MKKQHTVIFTPSSVRTSAKDGTTVYDVALRVGVDIQSICGGKGLCKRCQIEFEPGKYAKHKLNVEESHLSVLSPTEKKAIADGDIDASRRLACRAKIHGDVVIEVPSDSRELESSISKKSTQIDTEIKPSVKLYMCKLPIPTLEDNPSDAETLVDVLFEQFDINAIVDHTALTRLQSVLQKNDRTLIVLVRDDQHVIDVWSPSHNDVYGAAIDVGSTSIALYLFDLTLGTLVMETSTMNPQIRYGEDLMSRVSYVMMNKDGEKRLTDEIRKQIAKMLQEAFEKLGVSLEQLMEVVIVGNPIMHHLFLGISPVELGQAPFTLAIKNWVSVHASRLNLGLANVARVSFFPLIGGHVGADTAAAYLTQMDRMAGRSVLLVDIGTNAEIVLSHHDIVAAASSPTGPALEGAEISSGVRASRGAIERVRIDPDTKNARFKIIGHDEWLSDTDSNLNQHKVIGICGSGIFEVMVELASAGLVNKSGLFLPEKAPHRFQQEGKSWKYLLVDLPENPIYIKQTDIRAVQLAKAALSAGVSLLTEYLGCAEFDEVLLAGAFGTHLDSKYVADIGIIPNVNADNIHSIGNAAGMGAAMALLNTDEKERIIEAVQHVEKLETAMEPKFQHYFVEAMSFPTAPEAEESEQTSTSKRRRRRNR